MIWNNKRVDFQIYKEKKGGFMLAYNKTWLSAAGCAMKDCFCSYVEDPQPKNNDFCHTSCSVNFINGECYPISQRLLKQYPKWYEFLDNYIKQL